MNLTDRKKHLACYLVVLLSTGCSVGDKTASTSPGRVPEYQLPPQVAHHSFVWSAASGIDLATGAAVPTRALLESAIIVDSTTAREPGEYPGVLRAQPYFREGWGSGGTDDYRGTDYLRIMSVTPGAGGVKVLVCWDQSHTIRLEVRQPKPELERYWPVVMKRDGGLYPEELLLKNSATQAGGPQEGPRPAPAGDVLGDWQVAGFDGSGGHNSFGGRSIPNPRSYTTIPSPPGGPPPPVGAGPPPGADYRAAQEQASAWERERWRICREDSGLTPLRGEYDPADLNDPAYQPLPPSPGWPEPKG